jgi:hypothetical protein
VLKPKTRDAILLAIAKARSWIDDLALGRIESFAAIAEREGKVERHVRPLALLAFTPPTMVAEIISGTARQGPKSFALRQPKPNRQPSRPFYIDQAGALQPKRSWSSSLAPPMAPTQTHTNFR